VYVHEYSFQIEKIYNTDLLDDMDLSNVQAVARGNEELLIFHFLSLQLPTSGLRNPDGSSKSNHLFLNLSSV
jgi:hypothetical protein